MGPLRGARSQASSRPVPAEDDVPQLERRTKKRNDPAEQPGSSSAPPPAAKRGRPSSSGRGRVSRPENLGSSSGDYIESSSSSSESSKSQDTISEAKLILNPRKVKGIAIDLPTDIAASIFKVPDEGADYHNFEFDLHEAYTIMTGLSADRSDPKQTFVTKFNTNTFPPVLRVIHHMLTTIITPQGGGRDRLTDIQRFILYCMVKDIKINLHVILYQIISETTRKDLNRSLPYVAHLTSVFQHFGVPLNNEKSQSIPKSNIYTFKNIQKFMGFRLEGTQVRRGPVVVEAPQAQEEQPQGQGDQPQGEEEQPQGQGDQPQGQEEQPQAQGDQPQGQEDQPPLNEDQPQVSTEGDIPFHAPLSPQFQHFSPQPTFQASTSSGGPSILLELFSFLNDKFETLNTSIQTMSQAFELRIQRLENSVSAKFIEQKAASNYAAQRFKRLIGTLADASVQLKEHQQKLEIVLQGILENSQADVFNTKQTLHKITSTRLSFAHFVDDLESMRNFNAHIDNQITDLTKEFKIMQRPGTKTFCKDGVDTPHNGVDTTPQTQRQKTDEMLRLSTQDEGRSTLDLVPRTTCFQNWDSRSTPPPGQVDTGSIPRTVCLQNGTAGQHKMRAGRHWTSFPEQPVFRFGTVCRHHHQGRSTHYGKIPT
ncbi:hypothetical protein Taro_014564 [Colocasia esculenta]|uniref:Uncharacterized protein n=1 Tax=Colocasia esculenta TaxID=4460 RepID=A0A843UEW9_COLES|nr:hypothetical protein [Colocasia esculenta]